MSNDPNIPIDKLCDTMLSDAIVPINRFKLNFGFHDRVDAYMNEMANIPFIKKELIQGKFDSRIVDKRLVDKTYSKMKGKVPHRWLNPFFSGRKIDNPTRKESTVREAITQFAKEAFDTKTPPPYMLKENMIVLHPLWQDYFKRNLKIVRCWALWHWANYLQARNPHIPAVANKIGFPESRGRWNGERDFWRTIIEKVPNEAYCIYSKELLDSRNFHLDHYIPWSFVGHNRPWNVVPVSEKANERKGDNLPHDKYFPDFIDLQNKALGIWQKHAPNKFKVVIEAYRVDLQLTSQQLIDQNKLAEALSRTIPPIIETAKNNLFESDWCY